MRSLNENSAFRSMLAAALLFVISALAVGQQATPLPEPASAELIHYGDIVDVDVIGSFEYDWRGKLTPEGFLDGYDRIEEQVFALCRSEASVADSLRAELAKFLKEPQVSVRIIDRSNRALAYVDGAVRRPHRLQIKRDVSLNEVLAITGGITDTSSGEISIFRPASLSCTGSGSGNEAASRTINIKIKDLLSGKPDANPRILSGDIITVAEALPIYMIGGVNNPMQLSSRAVTTVARAVAAAGGVAKDGVASSVTIYRRDDAAAKIIQADLQKIADGSEQDIPLRPYDIVEVGQKGREKRRFPPVIDGRSFRGGDISKMPLRIVD